MDKYERGYKKSCNVKKIKYNGKVYKINIDELKKFLTTTTIVIAGVAILIGLGDKAIDNYAEYKEISQIKSSYAQVLESNTHRTYNNQGYWYDYEQMAKDLLQNPEDFGVQIYCIYDRIGYNDESKIECMNELFQNINFEISKDPEKYKDFEIYKNFGYFLMENGFTSTDHYEQNMEEVLELRANAKEGSSSWKK